MVYFPHTLNTQQEGGNTVDRARRNLPTVQRLQLVFYKKNFRMYGTPTSSLHGVMPLGTKKGSAVMSKVP